MSRIVPESASVADALMLRAWALELLIKERQAPQPLAELPASGSPATWELFLRSERCALALRARLAARSPLLERLATVELQRALSARAQLLEIGRLAAAHRLEPIVLKGGVAALSGDDPVDLADVDLLLPREQNELLADLLSAHGYDSTIAGSAAHLPARFSPETVPIELHFAINDLEEISELRARAQPVTGSPGLWRLSPPDHLWHLLVHSVVSHPERRGCLRDVLLIKHAARECSPAELEDVTRRIARSSRRSPLGDMLGLARAAGSVDGTDCFRAEAAANYLLRDRFPWLARWRVLQPMATTVFVLLGSRWDRQAEWAAVLRRRVPSEPSTWKVLAALQRRAPWLGDLTRRLLRMGRLVVARLLVWPIAARAKRLSDAQ